MPAALKTRTVRVNKTFANIKDATERYVVSYGGRRSSKSTSHSQLHVRRGTQHKRHFLVMRKVARSLRMSCWPRYKSAISEVFDLRDCDINKTDMSITIPTGTQFSFVGADDVEKLKSIEGITDVVWEEATEFDEIDLDTVDAGLSADVDPPPQHTLIFNPIPFIPARPHWLQRRFLFAVPHELSVPKRQGEVLVLRSYFGDNAFCPQKTIDLLLGYKKTNPQLYKMWALGEFTKVEGAIFMDWDQVRDAPAFPSLGLGLDFGFSGDPAALIRCWENSTDVWLQEIIYDWDLTNPLLSDRMIDEGVGKREQILADNAEPKSIAELCTLGWDVDPCDKGADYKRAAIRYLQGKHLHVVDGSPNLVAELASYAWPKDEVTGHFLPKIPDGNDHGIDASFYRLFTKNKWGVLKLPKPRNRPVTSGLRAVRF
jgi:phage terminase large subunit